MELDAKPTEENIVLVHDKILIALLGASGFKPVKLLTTGWPCDNPKDPKEPYAAYSQTVDMLQYLKGYEDGTVLVNLKDYLDSAQELEGWLGKIEYWPTIRGVENE